MTSLLILSSLVYLLTLLRKHISAASRPSDIKYSMCEAGGQTVHRSTSVYSSDRHSTTWEVYDLLG